jgi:hypothetical protein
MKRMRVCLDVIQYPEKTTDLSHVTDKLYHILSYNLSKMIEKIKLQLICIVEHILLESPRAEMRRKQPLENKPFAHFRS